MKSVDNHFHPFFFFILDFHFSILIIDQYVFLLAVFLYFRNSNVNRNWVLVSYFCHQMDILKPSGILSVKTQPLYPLICSNTQGGSFWREPSGQSLRNNTKHGEPRKQSAKHIIFSTLK